jgi:Bax protein
MIKYQIMLIKNKEFAILTISLFTFLFVSGGCNHGEYIKTIKKPIVTASDIVAINDSLVIPYIYTTAVSLKNLPVSEKKKKFFDMMLPAVLVAKKELAILLSKVEMVSLKANLSPEENLFIENLKKKYKAQNIELLKSRLNTFSVSIVLAQAAIESAWGTSRFFLEANNPFGLWSFNSNEDRIAASSTRSGKKVYLRKFSNMEQAIDGYFTTLATGPFTDFRKERLKTNDPYVLVKYLVDYSERREAYVKELTSVIRGNDLTKYDSYVINPEYIK